MFVFYIKWREDHLWFYPKEEVHIERIKEIMIKKSNRREKDSYKMKISVKRRKRKKEEEKEELFVKRESFPNGEKEE